jgi:hypothetical protein
MDGRAKMFLPDDHLYEFACTINTHIHPYAYLSCANV